MARIAENSNGNNARVQRAREIMQRYTKNIRNTRSYQNARVQADAVFNRNMNEGNSFSPDIDPANNIMRAARRRQYSQRTYMGLGTGG